MNLGRHSISATSPIRIFDARFDPEYQIFTTSTPEGFAIYRTCPLALLQLTGGTLAMVMPLHASSLLFLVGGGVSPLYPANKVIFWDDAIGSEVAELEFRERVRGLACRRGWLAVALRRRVVLFEISDKVTRHQEYETSENLKGLVAMASSAYSTLLAIPGRQMGHVQLIHLPPCIAPAPLGPPSSVPPSKPLPRPSKHPASIIPAHETALTTLAIPPSGRLLATTSSRGTLVRIWDVLTGGFIREFRRGTDKADIFGVAFRPDEQEICVWSDKGTIHLFSLTPTSTSNRQSTFSQLSSILPKYFGSEWSYAQYRIPTQSAHISLTASQRTGDAPDEERCVVGWIQADGKFGLEYQLIALTYTGGWYRLSIPRASSSVRSPSPSISALSGTSLSASPPKHERPRTSSTSSFVGRLDKGKEKESWDKDKKEGRNCILEEYRKYGRWDGWG